MGQLDIPDNGGLGFEFILSADRRDLNWSRGSFGAQSSLTYITNAIQRQPQTQINVDISNGSRKLNALDGMYVNGPEGTFVKAYTYYLEDDDNPYMIFRDGFWQLYLRRGGEWCMRQRGDAGVPPGGQWETAPRFMQARSDLVPRANSEWLAVLEDGVEHRVRVIEAREFYTSPGWRRLKGYSLVDGTTFDENDAPRFKCPAVSCTVKVTKAVGCGKPIAWKDMAQADPEAIKRLGVVDALEQTGCAVQAVGMELREELLESQAPSDGSRAYFEDFIDDGMSVLEL